MFKKYKQSFRSRLILLVTIATILPLFISGLVFWKMLDRQLVDILNSRLESGIESFSIVFTNKQNDLQQGLNRIAADNTLQMTIDLDIKPQLKKYLDKQIDVLGFYALNVYDTQYEPIAQSGKIFDIDNFIGEEKIKESIIFNGGHLILYQSRPIIKDSKIIAYLGAGVDLTNLDFLSRIRSVVKNNFILYLDRSFIYSDIKELSQNKDPMHLKSRPIVMVGRDKYQAKSKSWYIDSHEFSFQVLQSQKLLRRSFWSMTFSVSLAFVMIVAAMLFVFRSFVHEILKPVNKLTKEAKLIEQGQWPKLDLDLNRNDEFGVLNKAFLSMYDSINKFKNELEALVDERTLELKKAKEEAEKSRMEAEQANRSKSQFLANISHEIRTPLNCIIGFSDVVSHSSDLEQMHEHASLVVKESKHLLTLINMLLDHSKIESGKIDLEHIRFDINKEIQEIVEAIEPMAHKKGLLFLLDDKELNNKYFYGDPLRLRQVLMNLLSNAIKFTHEGQVKLVLQDQQYSNGQIKLTCNVYDSGVGISENDKAKIFESFTQADGSTTRKYGGTGLGTTISKELVELMGGEIGFESAFGIGTRFHFYVILDPASEQEGSSEIRNDETEENTGYNANLLLVEDYIPNQELVKAYLAKTVYKLDIVGDGQEAIDLMKKKEFDLVLMDVQMPNLNGYETTKLIREGVTLNSAVKILGMTASADAKSIADCISSGMDDVVTKPIIKNDFLKKLNYWIAKTNILELDNILNIDDRLDRNAVFDYNQAMEQIGGDESLLWKIVVLFIDSFVENLVCLNEALDEANFDALAKEAHKIKGTAANIAANALSKRALEIEEKAKVEDIISLKDLIVLLEQDYKAFKAVVESY